MPNPFATAAMAAGYAKSRPAVHPLILERIREHLHLTRPLARGLDVGCGAGMSTRALQAVAAQCLGLDPAEEMVRWGPAVAPGAAFAAAAAESLPVRSGSIDIITAAGSLNYADLDRFFPEAARVLKPGGVLAVYDFSEGRSFRGSNALDDWFAEFQRRYPTPAGSARDLDPEILANVGLCRPVTASETFEVALPLDPAFYLEYVLTETNVAQAIEEGVPAKDIRAWCEATLAPVFESRPREVLFRGYIAYM